ncbi:hypothetical protein C731_2652 [Mycolicibacterium hassiacum DSM 44199]|uniref:Uncharacterized protein n=1 Tax=Mycolicibacterium hassiacum (strain DSM 44199 / CIP 105218 / JCM 12690 / 3849) TaxID=1122247 RepID=K5BFP6_MYCHD|nr:hypothetical protein C731_2652 [Mycolicibacterium hassiacum DSM 44199]
MLAHGERCRDTELTHVCRPLEVAWPASGRYARCCCPA